MPSSRSWNRGLRLSLLTASLMVFNAVWTGAQQVCLPATSGAQAAVNVFLNIGSTQRWRQSLGITAYRVEDLRPLTDATDASLCRRMDSTFARLPAYYYAAGSYVIGTNYIYPLPERNEFAQFVFVFDSVGSRVPPLSNVRAPWDLGATADFNGRVALTWTNLSADVVSYRVQRATGSGAFAAVGGSVAGTATSATDTTTVSGTTYRYRLAAYRAGSDSAYSNEVSVTPANPVISRTTTGLLLKDDFNRADGSPGPNWVIESGGWAIVNNKLQATITRSVATWISIASTALPDRQNFHAQLTISRGNLQTYLQPAFPDTRPPESLSIRRPRVGSRDGSE
jgi:hypothetical protein